jgi:hypothetical protein
MARAINVPVDDLPDYGKSNKYYYKFIKIDDQGYHYIVMERGCETFHLTTKDIDELMYHVFEPITSNMASEYELQNRAAGRDTRRIRFKKQLELLGQINSEFANRRKVEIDEILQRSPFDDKLPTIMGVFLRIKDDCEILNYVLKKTKKIAPTTMVEFYIDSYEGVSASCEMEVKEEIIRKKKLMKSVTLLLSGRYYRSILHSPASPDAKAVVTIVMRGKGYLHRYKLLKQPLKDLTKRHYSNHVIDDWWLVWSPNPD